MIRRTVDGLVYYQFSSLLDDRVFHGVFTRLGGVSGQPFASLNLSVSVPDDPSDVAENRRRFYEAVGIGQDQAVRTVQVHGARVAAVEPADVAQVQQATDGLVTDSVDLPLVMAFADCTPIMLFDPMRGAVGIVHAGWRGTVAGVCQAAVTKMVDAYKSSPTDIVAAIGPAIGPCCYEVGPDLVEKVTAVLGTSDTFFCTVGKGSNKRIHFDQWATNEYALRQAGVQMIERAEICTACHVGEFYSHRAEGGQTGRFGAIIGLRDARVGFGKNDNSR
jgi:YfiH family protein